METPSRADTVGAALSALCMVHCASMPGLMVAAPAAASVLGGFHPVLLGGVALVAVVAFGPALRRHRDVLVGALALSGLGLLGLALHFEESVLETVLSVGGATCMMVAHLRNRALTRVRLRERAA